jgi:tetratricopeptide (TPR) repeat protein
MNIKIRRKVITYAILIIVIISAALYLPVMYYGNKIPDLPELSKLNNCLQNRLMETNRKAHRNPTSNNIGTLGTVYHSSQFYEKAAECYTLAIRRDASRWIWSYYLGCLDKEISKSEEAIHNFKRVLEKNPGAFHALYYLGEEYQNLGMDEDALASFSKLTGDNLDINKHSTNFRNDIFPLSVYAKYQASRIYLNLRKLDKAQEILLDILRYNTYGPAYKLLGNVYSIRGDHAASETCLIRSNELIHITAPVDTLLDLLAFRSNSEAYILKQVDQADYDSYADWAVVLIKNALRCAPDDKYVISKAVRILIRTRSGDEALQLLDRHFKMYNDDLTELKEVADLLYNNKFYDEAVKYYLRTRELDPGDTEIQANLVLSMLRENKVQEAENLLESFVRDQPENPEVIINACYISIIIEKRDKAEQYLERLNKISPSNPRGLLLSGLIRLQDGKTKEAETLFRASFRIKPEIPSIESLGDLLTEQKKWKEAIEHFSFALKSFPNEPLVLLKLGVLLVSCQDENLRDYDKGIEYLERLIVHRSCPPDYLLTAASSLSQAYKALGDQKKAAAYSKFANNIFQSGLTTRELIVNLENELKQNMADKSN